MTKTTEPSTSTETDPDPDTVPEGVAAGEAAAEETPPPRWRSVSALAELSDGDAEALAQRLAAAWMAPDVDGDAGTDGEEALAAAEALEAAELLGAVHAEAGHVVFVDFLRSFNGTAGVLGAVLDTAQLLRIGERDLVAASGMDAKALDARAEEISDLVLDGDLDAAVKSSREILVKVRSTLDRGRTSNPLAKLVRRDTSALRYDVTDLLSALSMRR